MHLREAETACEGIRATAHRAGQEFSYGVLFQEFSGIKSLFNEIFEQLTKITHMLLLTDGLVKI